MLAFYDLNKKCILVTDACDDHKPLQFIFRVK